MSKTSCQVPSGLCKRASVVLISFQQRDEKLIF